MNLSKKEYRRCRLIALGLHKDGDGNPYDPVEVEETADALAYVVSFYKGGDAIITSERAEGIVMTLLITGEFQTITEKLIKEAGASVFRLMKFRKRVAISE